LLVDAEQSTKIERRPLRPHKSVWRGVGRMPKPARNSDATRKQVQVDLALQGGGSHGAYTWGVLDRLLEEPSLKIEAISGTSAGAMNGAVLVSGYMQGGAEGARTALDAYWARVAEAARFSPIQRSPLDRLMNRWSLDTSPGYLAMDLMSRVISPYNLNPFGINPISDILEKSIDFAHLSEASIKLFITATNVHTGRGRVFRNKDITADVLLASACLPTMFQAIEIDGEPYWDGGFVGNPTITPLVRESDARDVILVQINPRERRATPRTATEILNRLNEISFNSPLMKELRMIALLRQAADPGTGEGARWASMLAHRIVTDKLAEFGASSKLNAEGPFLAMLKEEGRRTADVFLSEHGRDLGKRSTADLDFLLAEV
jgi:NTE family protein